MRIGIISDVHGNLEALEAVLKHLDEQKAERVFCLGDVVGYCADPSACLKMVRDRQIPTVLGNHDAAAISKISVEYFNPHARASVLWTMKQLSDQDKDYLSGLPLVINEEKFTLVHANLHAAERFGYILTNLDAYFSFQMMENQVCFVGHSHVPINFFQTTPLSYNSDSRIKLDPDVKSIVNVGSVGQPRDRNPDATAALWDTEEKVVEIVRLKYDIAATAGKIADAGLPKILADRLFEGI